jgi:hypothetical protein
MSMISIVKIILISLLPLLGFIQPSQTDSQKVSAWNEFTAFAGKEFQEMDAESRQRLFQLVEIILPQSASNHINNMVAPKLLHKFESEGKIRYVLFSARGLFIIPGDSRGQAYIFDEQGKLLWTNNFSLGWRDEFLSAHLLKENPLKTFLIQVATSYATQFYTVIDDELVLVRLQNKNDNRNQFVADNWIVGPPVQKLSPKEWEKKLKSENPAEVLQCLVWLGGKHWDLEMQHEKLPQYAHPSDEILKNSTAVRWMLASDSIQAQLKKLQGSTITWVSEAATLALRPEYGDAFHRIKEHKL